MSIIEPRVDVYVHAMACARFRNPDRVVIEVLRHNNSTQVMTVSPDQLMTQAEYRHHVPFPPLETLSDDLADAGVLTEGRIAPCADCFAHVLLDDHGRILGEVTEWHIVFTPTMTSSIKAAPHACGRALAS